MYGSASECQLRPILILQKKILRIIYNFASHASCTHLFTKSVIQTVFAMYVGALLKYLPFHFRIIFEECMSLSHNMKTRRQQKILLYYAKTSKLTENLIQYKAVKLYNMFEEIGLWPVGIYQEQNRMLHRFYGDILNLYLNENSDISVFFQVNCYFFYSTINSSFVSTSNSSASKSF